MVVARPEHRGDADHAIAARSILDDDSLAPPFRQAVGKEASAEVSTGTGPEGDHELHRTVWPCLRIGRGSEKTEPGDQRQTNCNDLIDPDAHHFRLTAVLLCGDLEISETPGQPWPSPTHALLDTLPLSLGPPLISTE